MGLDIRLPIGLMFLVVSALLLLAGVTAKTEEYKRSLDINVNLWWGLILLVFAVWMLFMAWRGSRNQEPSKK